MRFHFSSVVLFLFSSVAFAQLPPELNPGGFKAYWPGSGRMDLIVHSSRGSVEPQNYCMAYSGTMLRGHTIRMQPPEGSHQWGNPHLETIQAARIEKNGGAWNKFWGSHTIQRWTWGNTNRFGYNVAMGSVFVPRGYVLELYNNINYEPSGGGLIVAGAILTDLEDYAPQINSVLCTRTNEDASYVFPM
jgi:hypothetical protein